MRRPPVLIFDLDCTLIDSMPLLAQIFCDVLEKYAGVPSELSRGIYLSRAGTGVESQFREVLRRVEADDAAAHQLYDVFSSRSEALAAQRRTASASLDRVLKGNRGRRTRRSESGL